MKKHIYIICMLGMLIASMANAGKAQDTNNYLTSATITASGNTRTLTLYRYGLIELNVPFSVEDVAKPEERSILKYEVSSDGYYYQTEMSPQAFFTTMWSPDRKTILYQTAVTASRIVTPEIRSNAYYAEDKAGYTGNCSGSMEIIGGIVTSCLGGEYAR